VTEVEILSEFLNHLRVERGLAANTVESYRYDLLRFQDYLKEKGLLVSEVSQNVIVSYLSKQREQGKGPRTISRYLAAIRCFYHYLLHQNQITTDPTEGLESPKLEKNLPRVLSVEEVELLLSQPDLRTVTGLRDRAMLELMYATGMRVSELLGLNMENLSLDSGFVRCLGKGRKERIIPVGTIAVRYMKEYLVRGRPLLRKNSWERAVFLNRSGRRLSRQGFWKALKSYAQQAGIRKICHSPPGKWCGSPGCPGDPRSCRYHHNANLYPYHPSEVEGSL